MKICHVILNAAFAFGVVLSAQAADIAAGREMAETVCAACHGANGVSVSPSVPNLAAQRAGFTAMKRRAGWGNDFPGMIRNGNWHYAVFKADRSPRPNVNQASCLACHLPHAKNSYLFTMKALRDTAQVKAGRAWRLILVGGLVT